MKPAHVICLYLLVALNVNAQLSVTVSSPKIFGQKAVVPLAMKNSLSEKVESARAVCFLLDEQGKVVGQATRWVIGGSTTNGLTAGATNAFFFVVASSDAGGFPTTNLTASVQFSRLVLEGGKLADVTKEVSVTPTTK